MAYAFVRYLSLAALVFAAACGSAGPAQAPPTDVVGATDSTTALDAAADSTPEPDAAALADAAPDAAPAGADSAPEVDAGSAGQDASPETLADSGVQDDAGPTDSGPADGGPADSGPADGGPADSGPADSGPADDGSFGLLSLNLHCLKLEPTAYASNAGRFAAIAQLVADMDVSVLTLQEVCDDGTTNAMTALKAAIEAATGEAWGGAWALAHVGWEGTPDEADEGEAVLVRGAEVTGEPLVHLVQGGLRRVALTVALPEIFGGLRVTCVHFDVADATVRLMQAREVANAALVDAEPGFGAIVAGDFNAPQGSPAYEALTGWGFQDLSSSLEPWTIDHVMLHRGASWKASAAEMVFDGDTQPAVSDHPGVFVRIAPAEAQPVVVTRLEATADVGFGHWIAFRGDRAPLGWELGWPARVLGSDAWVLRVTTWDDGTFAYKALRDDADWMLGDDAAGSAGGAYAVTPSF